MTTDSMLLLALVAVLAAWLLVHVVVLVQVMRAAQLTRGMRALALLPVATPVLGFMAGARVASGAWVVLGVTYGLLWLQAANVPEPMPVAAMAEPAPPPPPVRNPSGDCPAPNNGARLGYGAPGMRWLPDCKTTLREQYFRVFASSEQRAFMLPRPDLVQVMPSLCKETEGTALRGVLDRYTLCAVAPDVERVNAMTSVDALAIAHALHERLRFTAQGGSVMPPPDASDVLAVCARRPELAGGVLAQRCAWERKQQRDLEAGQGMGVGRIPSDAEGAPLAAALNELYGIAPR